VLKALLGVVAEDERSPLRGATAQKVAASNGRLHLADDPSAGETFTAIVEPVKGDTLLCRSCLDGSVAADPAAVPCRPGGVRRLSLVGSSQDCRLGDFPAGHGRCPRLVEQAIFGEDLVDSRAPSCRVVFAEDS
jgi:hypothetical protein